MVKDLKFIVATHNPLFYNIILHNELKRKICYDY